MSRAASLGLGLVGCLAIALFPPSSCLALENCRVVEPITQLGGVDFYEDAQGSIASEERERENFQRQQGLMALLVALHNELDSAKPPEALDCALSQFRLWAQAGALLQEPSEATARVARVLAAVSLNLFALKLSSAGRPISRETLDWLESLTRAVNRDYDREAMKGTIFYRNNVYIWSGVAAGAAALLNRRSAFVSFSDLVWRDALETMTNEGLLPAEIARGRRALIYHQFAFSGLLLLREIRSALNLPVTENDNRRMRQLTKAIGDALCSGGALASRSGAELERPGGWGFRVSTVFGEDLINDDWRRCGAAPSGLVDYRLGGDLLRVRDAIQASFRK